MSAQLPDIVVRRFLSPKNIRYLAAHLGAGTQEHVLQDAVEFSRVISQELRWNDLSQGFSSEDLLEKYNKEFIGMHAPRKARGATDNSGNPTDGLPLVRGGPAGYSGSQIGYSGMSADDLLDRWWLGGSKPIHLRDDHHGERKESLGDADYLYGVRDPEFLGIPPRDQRRRRLIDRGTALRRREEDPDRQTFRDVAQEAADRRASELLARYGLDGDSAQQPRQQSYQQPRQQSREDFEVSWGGDSSAFQDGYQVQGDLMRDMWMSHATRARNSRAHPHEKVPLGNSEDSADDRIARRNLVRKTMSDHENGIRRMEERLYRRHYDRESASAGITGRELEVGPRGMNISSLHSRISKKQQDMF